MPRALIRTFGFAGLAAGLALLALWASGGLGEIERWALAGQMRFQSELAGTLRSLRQGQPGAVAALLSVAFAYGFMHAVGPGHGKVLIGGYGIARRVALLRLSAIAMLAALAQGTTAVVLVHGTILALGWGRTQIGALEVTLLAPVGHLMVAAIGLWLVFRGARGLMRHAQPEAAATELVQGQGSGGAVAYGHTAKHRHSHAHTHAHHSAADCDECGHSHGPSLAQVEAAAGWREVGALVAGIAVRPCSGALLVLVLTWQLGIPLAGIAAAYSMALGSGLVTVAVAGLAVWAREGAYGGFPALLRVRAVLPAVELLVGLGIAFVALSLLYRTI